MQVCKNGHRPVAYEDTTYQCGMGRDLQCPMCELIDRAAAWRIDKDKLLQEVVALTVKLRDLEDTHKA